jgi:D-arabinose 1-dehydrogenase-like Zn-dependent alcohol dehydrogenase
MQAIVIDQPGDETVMKLGQAPSPELTPGGLRIRVAAAGVNRADLMQRQGFYPPPPGASTILGLEVAGEVVEVAADVTGWKVGERAMALLTGGGYAQEVVAHAGSAMHVPKGMADSDAAALPEVLLTVFLNVFQIARLEAGGAVLVHGGAAALAPRRSSWRRRLAPPASSRRAATRSASAASNWEPMSPSTTRAVTSWRRPSRPRAGRASTWCSTRSARPISSKT